jgi:hypothetical protein
MRSRISLVVALLLLVSTITACSGNKSTATPSGEEQKQAATVAATNENGADTSTDTEADTDNNTAASADSNTDTENEAEAQESGQGSTGEGGIDVDKGLLNVEITIPAKSAEFYGFTFESQEDADAYAKEQGFKSVKLNDDGSITITMSKSKHKEFMTALKSGIEDGLQKMIGSEDYPNIVAIEHNDNYSEFKVTTKSEELSFNESFSTLTFYMYGGMYNSFNGTPIDNVHVDYINEESGEIINTFDSENME